MLILGAYPQQFEDHSETSEFRCLNAFLNDGIPQQLGVHVLPIWESEGDGGFAVSSWDTIDQKYGAATDLAVIGRRRYLLLDGIYNHVGWSHPIARKFLDDPWNNSTLLYAQQGSHPPEAPLAPRGGSVYRKTRIRGTDWHIWQTFGRQAVDVNLSHPDVMAGVIQNLQLLKLLNASGVRLDAMAYYGKSSASTAVHNTDGTAFAAGLASEASQLGLDVMCQIDCDDSTEHYSSLLRYEPTVVDYSFSTFFVLAMITGRTYELVGHLQTTQGQSGYKIIRPVRTHDGVLMRSGNQSKTYCAWVEQIFEQHGFQLRYTNDQLYESNHSLPHLLQIERSVDQYIRKLCIGLLTASMTAHFSYVFLNSLLGDWPESHRSFSDDPRELQRRPVAWEFVRSGPWSRATILRTVLAEIASWSEGHRISAAPLDYSVRSDGVLVDIDNKVLRRRAILNYSGEKRDASVGGRTVLECGFDGRALAPYGFVLVDRLRQEDDTNGC